MPIFPLLFAGAFFTVSILKSNKTVLNGQVEFPPN